MEMQSNGVDLKENKLKAKKINFAHIKQKIDKYY